MRNKLVSTCLIAAFCVSAAMAQNDERRFVEDYDMVAASINTAAKENNISFYRNNQIILLKPNPKGKNNKPVPFTSRIKENGDLTKPVLSKELSKLNITGTVAFDTLTGKMYYSRYNRVERDYALYETQLLKGKWEEPRQMDIEGTNTKRSTKPFMQSAGWNYRLKGLTGFRNPTIANGGKRIFFTARIRDKEYGNVGSTDIYFIDQNEDGSWTRPKNLGKNINTTGKEDYAFCLGDTALYFSSTGRGVDIYKSQLVDGEWQKAVRMDKPFNSDLSDQNIIIGSGNVYLVSNRTPKGKDDIYLFRRKPPKPIEPPVTVIPPPEEKEATVLIKHTWQFTLFYFDFDKHVLSEEFIRQFGELVQEMKQFPNETFELAGHTDQRGSDRYNQKLSERRAQFVKDLLIKEGFPADRLITKGFGEKVPVVEDPKSEDDFQQNRRVEITIYNPNKDKQDTEIDETGDVQVETENVEQ